MSIVMKSLLFSTLIQFPFAILRNSISVHDPVGAIWYIFYLPTMALFSRVPPWAGGGLAAAEFQWFTGQSLILVPLCFAFLLLRQRARNERPARDHRRKE